MQSILVVEDRESMGQMLKATLESEGFEAVLAKSAAEALKRLKDNVIHLVLTDLRLPGKDGLEVLRASREADSLRPVIVMTAHGSIESAVSAIKQGAYDFITKPFDTDHLLILVRRALDSQRLLAENILLKESLSARFLPPVIGRSAKIADVAEKIKRVAPAKSTVLLLGESGTGKELFARAIHNLSPRKGYPFIAINCAAIPRELMESELFGHEKGAFTGADKQKTGKLELAEGGTVFLDEIGELDLSLQAKLLRVLEESEIERVGGTALIKMDIRIVAASNKDLARATAGGSFREDLFYRLNVFPLLIPPLRERREDIPLLADYFVSLYAAELKTGEKRISPEALSLLCGYNWKGNVRELKNAIERAVILSSGPMLLPEHFNMAPQTAANAELPPDATLEEVSRRAQRAAEAECIRRALSASRGNKTRAAGILKVSYKTLLTKIKEYGLEE